MTSWGSRVRVVPLSGVGVIIRLSQFDAFFSGWSNYGVLETSPRWSPIYSTAESVFLSRKTRSLFAKHGKPEDLHDLKLLWPRLLKPHHNFVMTFFYTFILTLLLLPLSHRAPHRLNLISIGQWGWQTDTILLAFHQNSPEATQKVSRQYQSIESISGSQYSHFT